MAIIGKIQEKGRYLLVGIVGLALLTFILTSLFDVLGTRTVQGNIGTIAGEPVDDAKYRENVDMAVMNDQNQYAQQQRPYTDRDRDQSEDRAWQQTVDEILLGKEFEALGIEVSDRELDAYLFGEDGFQLMPEIQQNFSDPATGKFNPKALETYIEKQESDQQTKEGWAKIREQFRKQRQMEKYFQLLGQTVYVTKLEAKEEYHAQKEIKSISYVMRPFREIDDNDVKITEKEIRAFYDEHKDEKKYQALAGRDVKYFDILVQPSKADSTKFNNELQALKKGFAATTNDSLYVMTNSELKFYRSSHQATFLPSGDPKVQQSQGRMPTYPQEMDTVFKTAAIGQIVGPYNDNGKTRIAKVIDFNTKKLKARHILIAAQKGDKAAEEKGRKLADSLVKLINKDNFEEYVKQYSTDQGSVEKGGVYEDFLDFEMVPEFSDFAANQPVGKIGVVQTDYGFHIMEAMGSTPVKYPVLAFIEKTLIPSTDTENDIKNGAIDLLYKFDDQISKQSDLMKKLNLFDTLARREGYFARPVRMLDEAPKVTGFNTKLAEQKILQLAFGEEAEVGRLCSAPINDKGRYIIAMVSSIRTEKGAPTFEDSYQMMRAEAIKKKKADKILSQIGKTRDLNKLAKKSNGAVQAAEVAFANPSITGAGYEPEVVGAIFSGLKDGQITKPLVGNSGVYVIQLRKTTKAPTAANYDAERKQMVAQQRGQLQGSVRQALQKRNEVYDNRALLAAGVIR